MRVRAASEVPNGQGRGRGGAARERPGTGEGRGAQAGKPRCSGGTCRTKEPKLLRLGDSLPPSQRRFCAAAGPRARPPGTGPSLGTAQPPDARSAAAAPTGPRGVLSIVSKRALPVCSVNTAIVKTIHICQGEVYVSCQVSVQNDESCEFRGWEGVQTLTGRFASVWGQF